MSFKSNFLLWIVGKCCGSACTQFHRGIYLHTENHRKLDEWQVGAADWREPFHPANLPGVFFGELHKSFGAGAVGQTRTSFAAAGEHAVHHFVPAGGPGRVCERLLGGGPHDIRTGEIAGHTHLVSNKRFLLLCVAGIAIHYSLMFLLSSISFWTVRAQRHRLGIL